MESIQPFTCVVTDYVEPKLVWEEEQYRESNVVFRHNQLRLSGVGEIVAAVSDADVLIVDQARISEEVIQGLSRCKLIIRHGDGYDNLDLEAATEAGIVCANQPGFWSREVAEQAFALGLALALKIPVQQSVAASYRPEAGWDLKSIMPYRSLGSLTVGIVGCGKIGTLSAGLFRTVAEQVLVYDPYIDSTGINHTGGTPVSLEELVTSSDIVSIHIPATVETTSLFDAALIGKMKKGAILVNTARGAIVHTNALVDALASGRLGGAGLDSTVPEPLPADHPLFKMENVIITPHMAWYSENALIALRKSVVADVLAAREGKLPESVVNPEVLRRANLRMK